ncbi:urokinase plasminogen activator surface receptor-like [Hemiscyllium ocellatum]|uniref:urokinase plasminogen activator surface receptor-like n=1 Tax=Hemiscyllium ocellatum TaxID=170820 RepID=UPI002966B80F|nr:urokinase plasminogen activator surface receptor-like [Hemiscyllium ocellatum]
MKIQLAAVLLTVLVTQGFSLTCHDCNSLRGNCALNTTIECNRTIHSTCRSISVNTVIGASESNYLISGCGGCFGIVTFNSGLISHYVHTTCCSSNLCNDDVKPDIENSTLNGLECYSCYAVTEIGCNATTDKVKCRGQQDRCIHTSGHSTGVDPRTFVMKGCASDFLCRNPGALGLFRYEASAGFYCCKDGLCNLESRNFTRSTTPGPSTTSTASPSQLSSPLIMAVLLVFLRLVL